MKMLKFNVRTLLYAILVAIGSAALNSALVHAQGADPCKINALVISTGWNHATNSVDAVGSSSGFWSLVAAPVAAGIVPRAATVVAAYAGWGALPSSAWISGSVGQSYGTVGNFDFESCFCLCENHGIVRFTADILVDNTCQVFVNGTQIAALTSSTSFKSPATQVDVNITDLVQPGRNCIVVRVNNSSGPMGLNLQGTVSASNFGSLMRPECCGTTGSICGMVFNDQNENGVRDPNEPPMPNILVTATGPTISSVNTGIDGSYCLTGLQPGVYVVSEQIATNMGHTLPASAPWTYTVTITEGLCVENRDFGNRALCVKISSELLWCQIDAAGNPSYHYTFTVTSEVGSPAGGPSTLLATDAQGNNLTVTPKNFFLLWPPPSTSSTIEVVISGAGLASGDAVDLEFIVATGGSACHMDRTIVIPPCIDCCRSFKHTIASFSPLVSGSTSVLPLIGTISAGSLSSPIVKLEATLANLQINGNPAYGYFTSGTMATPFGITSGVVAPFGHELIWPTVSPGIVMVNSPFSVGIGVPPPFSKKIENIRYCIRFRFTDASCRTCDTVICATTIRYKWTWWEWVVGVIESSNNGRLGLRFPTLPAEAGSGHFVGLSLEADSAVITGAFAEQPGYLFAVDSGVAAGTFNKQSNDSLSLRLTYSGLNGRSTVAHRLSVRYVIDAQPQDTLVQVDTILHHRMSFDGGDLLGGTTSPFTHVKTYALHLGNSNRSREPITKLVVSTDSTARIVAVGPTAQETSVDLGFRSMGDRRSVADIEMTAIEILPGESFGPIYITLAGVAGTETTIHYRTINALGIIISQGELLLSNPLHTSTVPIERDPSGAVASLRVHPNPAAAEATIALRVDAVIPSATLVVSDLSGREIIRLMDGQRLMPGDHLIPISSYDLPSGTYYITLQSEHASCTQPLKIIH